jgi:hypothetical protein
MATAAIQHSPTVRRITTDLAATDIETRLTPAGDTLAEFHAMGHTFRLRISPDGAVLTRSCHRDLDGILSRREMEAVRDLCGRELAHMGCGHMNPDRDGQEILHLLGRAEIKLSLQLSAEERLTAEERGVLTSALSAFQECIQKDCDDADLQRFLNSSLQGIQQKLGV